MNSAGQRKEGTSQADAHTPSDATDKKQLLSDSSSDDGDIVAVAASDSDDMDRAFGLEEEAAKSQVHLMVVILAMMILILSLSGPILIIWTPRLA